MLPSTGRAATITGVVSGMVAGRDRRPCWRSMTGLLLADRIAARDIPLDAPWESVLWDLPPHATNAIRRLELRTLGQVVEAVQRETLRWQRPIGRKSWARLCRAVEDLATSGEDPRSKLGNPIVPDRFFAACLSHLPRHERALLTARILRGASLVPLGTARGVTRERVRQLVARAVQRLAGRLGSAAQELVRPLVEAMDRAGGLVHAETARKLLGVHDLGKIRLALLVAGEGNRRPWRKEFLVSLSLPELQDRLAALRRRLHASGPGRLHLDEAGRLAAEAAGLALERRTLERVLVACLSFRLEGPYCLTGERLYPGQALASLLRSAGRPMATAELEVALDRLRRDAPHGFPSSRAVRELAYEPRARLRCGVLLCGPRTLVHPAALPLPAAKVEAALDWCVRRLKARRQAISTRQLRRDLSASGLGHPALNEYLLEDLLGRRPEIARLHKFRVVYREAIPDGSPSLRDRGDDVLRRARRSLTLREVIRRIPAAAGYAPVSVREMLQHAPSVLRLGGRFLHVEATGLTAAQRDRVVRRALALLPADGSPVACRTLLQELRRSAAGRSLARLPDAPALLQGLLRTSTVRIRHQRSARLVALPVRRIPAAASACVSTARALGSATATELRQALVRRYGLRATSSSFYGWLASCFRAGLLPRLPGPILRLGCPSPKRSRPAGR